MQCSELRSMIQSIHTKFDFMVALELEDLVEYEDLF